MNKRMMLMVTACLTGTILLAVCAGAAPTPTPTPEPTPTPKYRVEELIPGLAGKRTVDIGGFKLNATIRGQGKPVVVFENGIDTEQMFWNSVQPLIADLTQTIAYDHAGIANSQPSPNKRCPEQFAEELHTLLQKAELPPPYVLVSYGTGDMTLRYFFDKYPAEVVGLVIVDGLGYSSRKPTGASVEYACWHEANAIEFLRSSTKWPDVPAAVVTMAKRTTHPRIQIWLDKLPKVSAEVSQIAEGWPPQNDPATVAKAIRKVLDAARK